MSARGAVAAPPVRRYVASLMMAAVTAETGAILMTIDFQRPLYGHSSPDTAYVVNDYPYGRRLRCKIRYWLESDKRRGVRFVSQTTNPKMAGERWNKPKPSTYALVDGCMYLDSDGHVKWYTLHELSGADEVAEFVRLFPGHDLTRVREWVRVRIVECEQWASGRRAWAINGVRQEPTADDLERWRDRLNEWRAVFPATDGATC